MTRSDQRLVALKEIYKTGDIFAQASKTVEETSHPDYKKVRTTDRRDALATPEQLLATKKKRGNPVRKFVERLDGDFYITQDAAEMLGVSVQTLRKYRKDGITTAPSKWIPYGKTRVFLYTKEDVETLRQYLDRRSIIMDRVVGD
jgi:hypothetical protein